MRRARGTMRIWSGEWSAWWRPDSAGYTDDEAMAGLYTRNEAAGILANCGPEKRLRVMPATRDWIVSLDTGNPYAAHLYRARTASAARYAAFKAWWEAGYGQPPGHTKRSAFLHFSMTLVRGVWLA